MAYPNLELINGLRKAVKSLREGAFYAWGHHGACNCGQLLQAVTGLSKEDILQYAHAGTGEWTELARDYCPVTGKPVDYIVSKLEALGLSATDIHELEYLSNRSVLNQLPGGFRWLQRNQREDVILYFEAMANQLEEILLKRINIKPVLSSADFLQTAEV